MKSRDEQYLCKLRDYYTRHGVMPSFSGIASLIGLRSTSAVSAMVSRFKAAKFLTSTPDNRLAPGARFFERTQSTVSVRAGIPDEAQDAIDDTVIIDRLLIDEPSCTVIIPIRGESMREAGLLDGDQLIVKRGAPASLGDIVVAIVDGEFTIKYLAKDSGGYYLKPGNKDFCDIRPLNEFELFGRVTGSFRKIN